jgi:hypothetical protein
MPVTINQCALCGTTDTEADIQEQVCANCFEAMPVGEWVTGNNYKEGK